MGDITLRALEQIKAQKAFFVEDTRSFKSLLNHFNLSVKEYILQSFHDHSSEAKSDKIIDLLNEGQDIFYASEAGSPIVSDPAFPLICKALYYGHNIKNYPGVTAPIAALEVSGLPPHPFSFWGFLPRKKGKKRDFLFSLKSHCTHIFFESLSRIENTVELIKEHFPQAQVSVCRELTKKFEQIIRFKALDWPKVKDMISMKGEFVLLIYFEQDFIDEEKLLKGYHKMALDYMDRPSLKKLAKLLGQILAKDTNEIYQFLLDKKKNLLDIDTC